MPINLKELLANQAIADDTEIPLKDGQTLRLGDIRAEFNTTGSALQQERKAREAAEAQRATLEETIKRLQPANPPANPDDDKGEPTDADYQEFLKSIGLGDDAGNQNGYDYGDPYSRGFRARLGKDALELINRNVKPLKDTLEKTLAANALLAKQALRQQAYLDFRDAGDWPEGYTPTRAFQEAAEKGYINRELGVPDLKKLHDELTLPQRMKTAEESAYQKGLEAGRQKAMEEAAAANRSRFKVVSPGNRNAMPATSGNKNDRNRENKGSPRLDEFVRGVEISDEDLSRINIQVGG